MATGIGANIVKDGLLFAYDQSSDNSWKGKPTTNFIHQQNAVAQESYTPYVQTASGAWQTNHPDAIRAYNASGGEITGYVNTGVGDYTNTWHAIWTYDDELKKPVVTMRDADANWKAKSFGTGKTMNSAGLAYGDTYTISYLQKVNNLSKRLRVGVYGRNTGGSNGFHDGLQGEYNTKINTWERVYSTYTVSTAWNLDAGLNIYMYGHYDARATIHIADVQWEKGTTSKFSPTETRSNTQALLDWTGNNTITATSLTYNADATFEFVGSENSRSDILTIADTGYPNTWDDPYSLEAMIYIPTGTTWYHAGSGTTVVGRGGYGGSHGLMRSSSNRIGFWQRSDTMSRYPAANLSHDTWYHIVGTNDGAGNMKFYVNGDNVANDTLSWTSSAMDGGSWLVGGGNAFGGQSGLYGGGKIPLSRLYNKALTAQEVQQNFNALRGRYGI